MMVCKLQRIDGMITGKKDRMRKNMIKKQWDRIMRILDRAAQSHVGAYAAPVPFSFVRMRDSDYPASS